MTNILLLLILLVLCPILIPIGLVGLVWLFKVMAPLLLAAAVIAVLVKAGLIDAAWQRVRNRHALKIEDSEEK